MPRLPYNTWLLEGLAERLGVDTSRGEWYAQLYYRLLSSPYRAHVLAVRLEERKGWLLSTDLTRIIRELSASDAAPARPGVTPQGYYIDGGGGGLDRFYWFVLSLNVDPFTGMEKAWRLSTPLKRVVCLGSYVTAATFNLMIQGDGRSRSCVRAAVNVYDASNWRYLGGDVEVYLLAPGERIAPVIHVPVPYGSVKTRIVVDVSSWSYSYATVWKATLEFAKSYPSMPTPETRQGGEAPILRDSLLGAKPAHEAEQP